MDLFPTLQRRQAPLLIDLLHFLEKLLPVRLLYWLLYPYAVFRARRDPVPYITALPIGPPLHLEPPGRRSRVIHVIRLLRFLPDRLTTPRWKKRCRITGLDRLLEAHRRGPVVLACAHIGPLSLTGYWLRANGIPVTAIRDAAAGPVSRANDYASGLMPFPEIPAVVTHDQVRTITQLLKAGGAVMIAIDSPIGKQVDIPADERWIFRMATGPMRLAAYHGAELIPCTILHEGNWRFRIELGEPVPRGFLRGQIDQVAVGRHLYSELLPHWLAHPEQCLKILPKRFYPASGAAACDPPS